MDLGTSALTPAEPARPKRLYDLRAIEIATALGSLFAGAFLMSRNFAALGEQDRARNTLIVGFLGLIPLAFLVFAYTLPERFVKLDQALVQGGQALLLHFIAKRQLGSAFLAHKAAGGLFFSRWRAAGIALLLTPVALCVMVAVAFVFPDLPALLE